MLQNAANNKGSCGMNLASIALGHGARIKSRNGLVSLVASVGALALRTPVSITLDNGRVV